jgi:hypothetical protein
LKYSKVLNISCETVGDCNQTVHTTSGYSQDKHFQKKTLKMRI